MSMRVLRAHTLQGGVDVSHQIADRLLFHRFHSTAEMSTMRYTVTKITPE
jgi:hypothetical protein